MRPIDHPSEFSPAQHLHELTGILAVGVLRLKQRRLRDAESASSSIEVAQNSAAGRLEDARDTALTVHTG